MLELLEGNPVELPLTLELLKLELPLLDPPNEEVGEIRPVEDLPLVPAVGVYEEGAPPGVLLDLGLENLLELDDDGFTSTLDGAFCLLLLANLFLVAPPEVFAAGVAVIVGVKEFLVIVVALPTSPVFFLGRNVGLGLEANGLILGVNVFFLDENVNLDVFLLPPSSPSSSSSSSSPSFSSL